MLRLSRDGDSSSRAAADSPLSLLRELGEQAVLETIFRTGPITRPEIAATSSRVACTASSTRRAPVCSARPGPVTATGVTDRSNRDTPSSCSSRATALDMADWTMCTSRAAAVKLPVRQQTRKYSKSRISTDPG